MSNNARIYVACLEAYNNGCLHGDWIDVEDGIDAIWDSINAILANSPYAGTEEWAIHDAEGFGSLRIGESTDLETVVAYAEFLAEHGEELGSELLNYVGGDIDDARRFMDEYHGEFDSEEDFAEQMADQFYTIPDELVAYIDYEKIARDWFIDSFLSIEVGRKVHVFSRI